MGEPEREPGVHVVGRAHALADREGRLVHELADDSPEHQARARPRPIRRGSRASRRTPRQPRRRSAALRAAGSARRGARRRAAAAGGTRPPPARRGATRLVAAHSTSSGAPPGGEGSRARPGVDNELRRAALAQLEAGRPGTLAEAVRQRTIARESRRPCPRRRRARAARDRRAGRGCPRRTRSSRARSFARAGRQRPCAPGWGSAASAARRTESSVNDLATSKPTSIPTRSISSNGPMRKPPPSRQMRSICSWRGRALLEQPQRLRAERAAAAVHQEAGAVGRDDHVLAHRLAGADRQLDRPLGALLRADHLEQRHQRRRVEEVHPDDVLRPRGRAGKRGHRNRRRIRGQHHVVAAHQRQGTEQVALQVGALGRRLDHELARRQLVERAHRLEQRGRILAARVPSRAHLARPVASRSRRRAPAPRGSGS